MLLRPSPEDVVAKRGLSGSPGVHATTAGQQQPPVVYNRRGREMPLWPN